MRLITLAGFTMLGAGCVDAVSSDQEILFLTGTPEPVGSHCYRFQRK